jgi:RecA-family ATPase
MLKRRFKAIFKELDIDMTRENVSNIRPWNLRGKALPLDELAPKVIRRARAEGPFTAIVLDPVYKVQQGDENSAEAISKFCNALDKIAEETGAAVIYDHHHPKGDAGGKKAIDRGAGSGVFARDADALVDISNLDPGNDASDLVGELMASGEKPMILSFVLRDFKDQPDQKIWFKYPLHYIDSANLLENCYIEGSWEANASQNPNRISDDEKKRIVENAFLHCQVEGRARVSEMAEYSGRDKKTIRKYAIELGNYDVSERGYIKRDIDDLPDVLK